ncbi:hypothetical protein [Streptomyces sp. NPDC055506]
MTMGLDITVLAVDWERLERTPFEERYALLEDASPTSGRGRRGRTYGSMPPRRRVSTWTRSCGT